MATIRYTPAMRKENTLSQTILSGVREPALLSMIAVAGAVTLGAMVRIPQPFSAVPITLSTLPVLAAPFVVGRARATAGLMLYIVLGLLGTPLFADQVHFGSTFGYLLAFLAVPTVATCFRSPALGLTCATLVIYVFGTAWLALFANLSPWQAFMGGVAPFIIGDAVKAVVAYRIAKAVPAKG